MAAKCNGCGRDLPQPDPSIIIDYDAIKAILTMFPDEGVEDDYDSRKHMLMIKNEKEIIIRRNKDQMIFNIYYVVHDDTLHDAYIEAIYLHMPPRPNVKLTKEDVEQFIPIVSQLEKDGWTYDAKERGRSSDNQTTSYDYPLPKNRALFIELLKKVYTLPMTKKAL